MASVAIACILFIPFIVLFQFIRKNHWKNKQDWTAVVNSFTPGDKHSSCTLYIEDEKRKGEYTVKTDQHLKVGQTVDIKWDNISEEAMIKDDADSILDRYALKKYLWLWLAGWGLLIVSILLLAVIGNRS